MNKTKFSSTDFGIDPDAAPLPSDTPIDAIIPPAPGRAQRDLYLLKIMQYVFSKGKYY